MKTLLIAFLALAFVSCDRENPVEAAPAPTSLTGNWKVLVQTDTATVRMNLTITQYGDRIAAFTENAEGEKFHTDYSGTVVYANRISLNGGDYPKYTTIGADFDSTFSTLKGQIVFSYPLLSMDITRQFTADRQ